MIALWIIAGIVWLGLGYIAARQFSKEDDVAPPLLILICLLASGPLLWVIMYTIIFFIEFVGPRLRNLTGFSMEKYIRKFLGMKEK